MSISEKSKENRIKTIKCQLSDLWQKFRIPILSKQIISAHIKMLLTNNEKNQKYTKMYFEEALEDISDIISIIANGLTKKIKIFIWSELNLVEK